MGFTCLELLDFFVKTLGIEVALLPQIVERREVEVRFGRDDKVDQVLGVLEGQVPLRHKIVGTGHQLDVVVEKNKFEVARVHRFQVILLVLDEVGVLVVFVFDFFVVLIKDLFVFQVFGYSQGALAFKFNFAEKRFDVQMLL